MSHFTPAVSPSRTSTKITVQAMPLAAYHRYLMRARRRSHKICRAAYTTTIADTGAMPAMANRLVASLACSTGPRFVKTCATMTAITTTATVSRFAVGLEDEIAATPEEAQVTPEPGGWLQRCPAVECDRIYTAFRANSRACSDTCRKRLNRARVAATRTSRMKGAGVPAGVVSASRAARELIPVSWPSFGHEQVWILY